MPSAVLESEVRGSWKLLQLPQLLPQLKVVSSAETEQVTVPKFRDANWKFFPRKAEVGACLKVGVEAGLGRPGQGDLGRLWKRPAGDTRPGAEARE